MHIIITPLTGAEFQKLIENNETGRFTAVVPVGLGELVEAGLKGSLDDADPVNELLTEKLVESEYADKLMDINYRVVGTLDTGHEVEGNPDLQILVEIDADIREILNDPT